MPEASSPPDSSAASIGQGGLRSPSFLGLLLTQGLGATNDNTFRLLVIGICTPMVDKQYSSMIISAGLACFTLPYLLLAAPAGYLADKLSKRRVIVACKIAEIVLMSAAVGAIYMQSVSLVLVVLFLMGSQSALFSPAKLGSIPEMLRAEKISAANGLMGLVTIMATVAGIVTGLTLAGVTKPGGPFDLRGASAHLGLGLISGTLLGLASVGTLTSLLIARLPPASPQRQFPWMLFDQTWRDLRALISRGALLRAAYGIAYFWSLAALAQANIIEFGAESGLEEVQTRPLFVALVVGVGLGSVLAGFLSGGKVELGMLPIGATGMAISAMALFTISPDLWSPQTAWTAGTISACVWLFLLGISSGIFDVPLEAFMQHRSPRATRGSILAASNFISFAGMSLIAVLFFLLRLPVIEPHADLGPPLAELPAAQRERIETKLTQYEDAWEHVPLSAAGQEKHQPPTALEYWQESPEADRRVLLRELVRVDQRERVRRDKQDAPSFHHYRRDFPDERDLELIRAALDENAPLLSARQIFFLAGACTVPIIFYIIWVIPEATLRFMVWLASKTFYRIRVYGQENLPAEGGALLVANHVSWLDGVLLLLVTSRPVRMIADEQFVSSWWVRRMARVMQVITINPRSKSSIRRTIETAREALRKGDLVCIFPEGGITRTGELQPFKRGMLTIAEGTHAPIIPVFLDELWGSIFSYHGGRFFWKLPRRWPYPVSIHFGPPLSQPQDTQGVRQAVAHLGAQAVEQRMSQEAIPPRAFLRACRKNRRKQLVVDSLGEQLTGGQVLLRSLILRRLLLREVLADEEKYVGILIPPSAGGVIVNAVMPLTGRIGVNLNYTLSKAEMDHCIRECGIKNVLTTHRVVDQLRKKFSLEIDSANLVYLDDLRGKITLGDKLAAAAMAHLMPTRILERRLGVDKIQPDDVLTVIFTSGSTAMPKGVMLTHRNIGSNVSAINQLIQFRDNDVIAGTLPLFHSLGYTTTMWTVLMLGRMGAYHPSPLDYKIVGRLCRETKATILLTTPTFLRGYLKRCQPEDLVSLDVVVAGAEKLPVALCDAFEKKFGVRPVEGYGTTELSPLVSCNIPSDRLHNDEVRLREGSVGRAVPGVEAKIVDPDTGEDRAIDEEGMLLVRGPNVMKGYLHHPEKTAEVIRGGWYVTGDIARIDADGFIFITGRLSRFSKIGGEMVPHLKIEEELHRILGKDEELRAAVTAVPDERKGERLVVLHMPLEKNAEDIRRELLAAGLPNLFVPGRDGFCQVDEIPVLGSGKLDLKALKQLALEKFSEPVS